MRARVALFPESVVVAELRNGAVAACSWEPAAKTSLNTAELLGEVVSV